MTLPFGAKFDWLISFEFQAKVSKHLMTNCWLPERVGSHHLGVGWHESSFNSNLFVD